MKSPVGSPDEWDLVQTATWLLQLRICQLCSLPVWPLPSGPVRGTLLFMRRHPRWRPGWDYLCMNPYCPCQSDTYRRPPDGKYLLVQ